MKKEKRKPNKQKDTAASTESSAISKFDQAAVALLSRVEKPLIVAFCLLAALRVFLFSAAFPFFNNVDEQAHVDMVLKYAGGHLPDKPLERYDTSTARLIALYGSPEFFNRPEQFGGAFPAPAWGTPAIADAVMKQGEPFWTERENHESNSPPVYYAIAGMWYAFWGWLGSTGGKHLYWIRFLNVPLFVLLTYYAYAFCKVFYPDRLDLRLGVPLLLCFFPQDVFYAVNSDVLSPLFFIVSLMLLLHWLRRKKTSLAFSAVVGLMPALSFLVKYTNVALIVIVGTGVLVKGYRLWKKGERKNALTNSSAALVGAVVPIAVWFGRNYRLLGDLTGARAKVERLDWSPLPFDALLAHPIFSLSGFWIFWSELMKSFWRGEFVWHGKAMAQPVLDNFYIISSTALLLLAACAWLKGRKTSDADISVWSSVILSVLSLVWLSASFDYGRSIYPSKEAPYFTSGRLIAGALVPFLVLYVNGIAFLLRPLSRVVAPLLFIVLAIVVITKSEFVLSTTVFGSPYNWFHMP